MASRQGDQTKKTVRTAPFSANYRQCLDEGNIHFFSETDDAKRPMNYEEIMEALKRARQHDPEHSSFESFRAVQVTSQDPSHSDLVAKVLPALHGTPAQGVQDHAFTMMLPENIFPPLNTKAKPDYYEGVSPKAIDHDIRNELGHYIIPTKKAKTPVAPNFFLEIGTKSRNTQVTENQAGIEGVLGACCMSSLLNFPLQMPLPGRGAPPSDWKFDGTAYSFCITYRPMEMKIYSIHMTKPEGDVDDEKRKRPGYSIFPIETFPMSREGFYLEAIRAFRNIRDLAQELRERLVEDANSKARERRQQEAQQMSHASDAVPDPAGPEESTEAREPSPSLQDAQSTGSQDGNEGSDPAPQDDAGAQATDRQDGDSITGRSLSESQSSTDSREENDEEPGSPGLPDTRPADLNLSMTVSQEWLADDGLGSRLRSGGRRRRDEDTHSGLHPTKKRRRGGTGK